MDQTHNIKLWLETRQATQNIIDTYNENKTRHDLLKSYKVDYTKNTDNTIEALFDNGAHIAIAYATLKNIAFKSGGTALEILSGANKPFNFEDLCQVSALAILECPDMVVKNGMIDFDNIDDTSKKAIFSTVSSALYRQATRIDNKYKSLYIEIDGEELLLTDYIGISSHVGDEILSNHDFNDFLFWCQGKTGRISYNVFCDFITLRALGHNMESIKKSLNLTQGKYNGLVSKLKAARKEYLNNDIAHNIVERPQATKTPKTAFIGYRTWKDRHPDIETRRAYYLDTRL